MTQLSLNVTYPQARLMMIAAGMYLQGLQQGQPLPKLDQAILPALEMIANFAGREPEFDSERQTDHMALDFTVQQATAVVETLAFLHNSLDRVENDSGDHLNQEALTELGEYMCEEIQKAA